VLAIINTGCTYQFFATSKNNMSSLNTNEKQILEKLFQMNGYVLNFTDRTMGEFFKDDVGIDIYDEKYNYSSGSKANYVRRFWIIGTNAQVGKSIQKLIEYIEDQILIEKLKKEDFSQDLIKRGKEIANNLLGIKLENQEIKEDEFINRHFKDASINKLGLDTVICAVLQQRMDEIKKCLDAKTSLAVIFLCGSTLEGILLGVATKAPKEFNNSILSPKNKSGEVKKLPDWTLNELIDVARDLNLLGEDVKKFSHVLRSFRNYIHPYQQQASNFNPDEHTAVICWQVLQAAITQLSK
jgi:hypothetical protein